MLKDRPSCAMLGFPRGKSQEMSEVIGLQAHEKTDIVFSESSGNPRSKSTLMRTDCYAGRPHQGLCVLFCTWLPGSAVILHPEAELVSSMRREGYAVLPFC